ncbi:hypothetical protein [Rhizobium freirei]|uniref:hypothetical protein n=1 Tax=Rhizobium freirei TaxID=1353277 RepID=UPI0012FA3073|nr:hypothetical protein [Rhizobium freirei]
MSQPCRVGRRGTSPQATVYAALLREERVRPHHDERDHKEVVILHFPIRAYPIVAVIA